MNKIELLQILSDKVACCTKCPELVANRTNTVFGDGNENSKVLLLGEAAGETEDREGKPFVGKAGHLLTNILKACGIERDEVYICNILKCRPPKNRVPTFQEAENCESFLNIQIQIVNPKFIVCMGATATKYLLGIDQPMGHMRGRWFKYENEHVNADVLCTYHPSYGLRTGDKGKQAIFDDLQLLVEKLSLRTPL